MRLTIVPVDKTILVDGVAYHDLDLSNTGMPSNIQALQWYETHGEIEFIGPAQNEPITELPDWANACVQIWSNKNDQTKNPPALTPEQIIASNENTAKYLLKDSDWAVLPDVALSNKSDWESYRTALRQISTNPTVDPIWPTKPEVIWV